MMSLLILVRCPTDICYNWMMRLLDRQNCQMIHPILKPLNQQNRYWITLQVLISRNIFHTKTVNIFFFFFFIDINHTELIPIEKKCIKCHCGKICKTQKSLSLHQRVHLSEKPFKCEYCPENFKFKLNAFWHVNKVHKRTCKDCGRLFQTPKGLKMHHKLNSGH